MGQYRFPIRVQVSASACLESFRRAAPLMDGRAHVILAAQTHGVEAGGGHSIRNFNMGGAKAKIGGAKDWTFFATRDPAGPKDPTIVLHPAPSIARQQSLTDPRDASWSERVTCFRAFESLDAATIDHVELLRDDFPAAYEELTRKHPDAARYSHALKIGRYYTADEGAYTKALLYWVGRYETLTHA